MTYPFGRDFVYTFYPELDGKAMLGVPSQTPNIYLFTDSNAPTRATGISGVGSFRNITSWTKRGEGFEIAISSIQDPDVNSELAVRTYYIAINFILFSGGQSQLFLRTLEMERVRGHHDKINVVAQDLIDSYPGLDSFVDKPMILSFLEIAKDDVKGFFLDEGLKWAEIYELEALRRLVINCALAYIMANQRRVAGDVFDLNYEMFNLKYESLKKSLKVRVDRALDGRTKPAERTEVFNGILVR